MFSEIFKSKSSSQGIFLGAPEAEAEISQNSRMPLSKVYFDYHNLAGQLSAEKFIIIGRKGSGKSAFAEYVVLSSGAQATVFAKFIRKNDFALETIVQSKDQSGNVVDSSAFFRWLIYVNLIRLLLESEAVKSHEGAGLLEQFLDRNSGYVDVRSYQIVELIRTTGFEINIEYFKRYMRSKFKRDIGIKEERAPYFKLLPHLEEVIVTLLSSKAVLDNDNSFLLFFDDLDLGFSPGNRTARDLIVDLMRVAKNVNNDVFGRRGLKAKAVILLRDDIEKELSSTYADTAKIFASYGARIAWYQDGFMRAVNEEDDLYLKRFINRRIEFAFKDAKIGITPGSPWDSLVKFSPYGKTTFKDVVNNTFYRPRDLLLFFHLLDKAEFKYPLDYHSYSSLVHAYSGELAKEIKNEMVARYDEEQIETIMRAIAGIDRKHDCSFADAVNLIRSEVARCDPEEVLSYLFGRSLVGTRNPKNNWLTFSCRSDVPIEIARDQLVVVQYGMRDYINQKY